MPGVSSRQPVHGANNIGKVYLKFKPYEPRRPRHPILFTVVYFIFFSFMFASFSWSRANIKFYYVVPVMRSITREMDRLRLILSNCALPRASGTSSVSSYASSGAPLKRDDHGVPEIKISNSSALAFMQGYIHASDRLLQMEIYRRTALGTLSELYGNLTLDSDKMHRSFNLITRAQKDWSALSLQEKELLEAYTQGVNAFVAETRTNGSWSLEFDLLYGAFAASDFQLFSSKTMAESHVLSNEDQRSDFSRLIRDWEPTHSLAILRLIAYKWTRGHHWEDQLQHILTTHATGMSLSDLWYNKRLTKKKNQKKKNRCAASSACKQQQTCLSDDHTCTCEDNQGRENRMNSVNNFVDENGIAILPTLSGVAVAVSGRTRVDADAALKEEEEEEEEEEDLTSTDCNSDRNTNTCNSSNLTTNHSSNSAPQGVDGMVRKRRGALLANSFMDQATSIGFWYLMTLGEVSGASIPGIPLIFAGRNQHISWGITFPDRKVRARTTLSDASTASTASTGTGSPVQQSSSTLSLLGAGQMERLVALASLSATESGDKTTCREISKHSDGDSAGDSSWRLQIPNHVDRKATASAVGAVDASGSCVRIAYRPEHIHVRGVPGGVTYTVRETKYGPIISDHFAPAIKDYISGSSSSSDRNEIGEEKDASRAFEDDSDLSVWQDAILHSRALEAPISLQSLITLYHGRGFEDIVLAAEQMSFLSLQFIYADALGNIGTALSSIISSGVNHVNTRRESISSTDQSASSIVYNPPSGVIIAVNTRPDDCSTADSSVLVGRIRDHLERDDSIDQLKKILLDTFSPSSLLLRDILLSVPTGTGSKHAPTGIGVNMESSAAGDASKVDGPPFLHQSGVNVALSIMQSLVREFDGEYSTQSPAATVIEVFRTALVGRLVRPLGAIASTVLGFPLHAGGTTGTEVSRRQYSSSFRLEIEWIRDELLSWDSRSESVDNECTAQKSIKRDEKVIEIDGGVVGEEKEWDQEEEEEEEEEEEDVNVQSSWWAHRLGAVRRPRDQPIMKRRVALLTLVTEAVDEAYEWLVAELGSLDGININTGIASPGGGGGGGDGFHKWSWGKLHRAHFHHPFVSHQSPVMAEVMALGPVPIFGGLDSIFRSDYLSRQALDNHHEEAFSTLQSDVTTTLRMVFDMGDQWRSACNSGGGGGGSADNGDDYAGDGKQYCYDAMLPYAPASRPLYSTTSGSSLVSSSSSSSMLHAWASPRVCSSSTRSNSSSSDAGTSISPKAYHRICVQLSENQSN